jgi:hypothetical protein
MVGFGFSTLDSACHVHWMGVDMYTGSQQAEDSQNGKKNASFHGVSP